MVEYVSRRERVGHQFGNYRLLQFLGAGKEADIYLGEHIHLQTRATVKLYQLRLLHNDQRDFLTEARIIAHLVHPHIIRVLEFGVEGDTPFLALSYAARGPLRHLYPAGTSLSWPTLLAYTRQIASALDYAHGQHVYHLDLRPENMWIGHNNEILLSDFRITLFSYNSRSESLRDIAGAAAYMAPEQIQGQPSVASDQYALGIVVYEWLCGFTPFSGADYLDVALQQLHTPPPSLVGKVQHLSPAVEQVIMRALAKDPARRFASLQDFVSALESSENASEDASRYVVDLPDSLSTVPLPEHSSISSVKARLSRRAIVGGAAGLIGVAAAGSGLAWFLRSSPVTKPSFPAGPVPPGTTLYTYRQHVDVVYGVAWSRDGQRIASWSQDDTMQIWNAATGSLLQTYPMSYVLSWSPDWLYIASGGVEGFRIWEIATGNTVITHDIRFTGAGGPMDFPVNAPVKWSPDGRYVVTTIDSTQVWDVTTRKNLFTYPRGFAAWSPNGKRIAIMPIDDTGKSMPLKVQILEVATENQVASYQAPRSRFANAYGLAWSPDGNYLASGSGLVWQATTGKVVSTYQRQFGDLVWSPDSRHLASFDNSHFYSLAWDKQLADNQGQGTRVDSTVHIWNALTGKDVFIYHGHTAGVNYVAWSSDGKKIASASEDMTVKVWQALS